MILESWNMKGMRLNKPWLPGLAGKLWHGSV